MHNYNVYIIFYYNNLGRAWDRKQFYSTIYNETFYGRLFALPQVQNYSAVWTNKGGHRNAFSNERRWEIRRLSKARTSPLHICMLLYSDCCWLAIVRGVAYARIHVRVGSKFMPLSSAHIHVHVRAVLTLLER